MSSGCVLTKSSPLSWVLLSEGGSVDLMMPMGGFFLTYRWWKKARRGWQRSRSSHCSRQSPASCQGIQRSSRETQQWQQKTEVTRHRRHLAAVSEENQLILAWVWYQFNPVLDITVKYIHIFMVWRWWGNQLFTSKQGKGHYCLGVWS